jgi:hypothetical protein
MNVSHGSMWVESLPMRSNALAGAWLSQEEIQGSSDDKLAFFPTKRRNVPCSLKFVRFARACEIFCSLTLTQL